MQAIRQKIYDEIIPLKDKKVALAWDGGPYGALVWWLAYKDLGIELPIVFIDNGKHPVPLYMLVETSKREYKLNLETIRAEDIEAELKKLDKKYDTLLTGEPTTVGKCPVPHTLDKWTKKPTMDPKAWNLLKMVGVPFYEPKASMLGGRADK